MGTSLACFSPGETKELDDTAANAIPIPQPSSPARRSSFFRRSFRSKEKDENDPSSKNRPWQRSCSQSSNRGKALLNESGFRVEAVDLTGLGIQASDTNSMNSMAQYVKPPVNFLEKQGDLEKVILVGHDFGGASASYVMESHQTTIAKTVFIAATMLWNGQGTLDMFSQEECQSLMMRRPEIFLYGDGNERPPTAINFEKDSLMDRLFNQCSSKDVVLALVSMWPVPFGPVGEKLSLSEAKYGSVRKFYIVTRRPRHSCFVAGGDDEGRCSQGGVLS